MNLADYDKNYQLCERDFDKMISEYFKDQFVYIGTFGLKDKLRPRVRSCVQYARENAKICVRMISGDHKETAKAVAIQAGILLSEEAARTNAVMTAQEFNKMISQAD